MHVAVFGQAEVCDVGLIRVEHFPGGDEPQVLALLADKPRYLQLELVFVVGSVAGDKGQARYIAALKPRPGLSQKWRVLEVSGCYFSL